MGKYYYKKGETNDKTKKRKMLRFLSLGLFGTGVLIIVYIFLPFLSWQIYFAPAFANQNIAAPIPKNTLVSSSSIQSLIQAASSSLAGIDFENAQNWFPNYKYQNSGASKIPTYTISIPKLGIKNAVVSTIDTDLSKHLVNYYGTSLPPDKGNAVIFGHSTLPQLFDSNSYKTTFTYLFELKEGDEIIANVGKASYRYRIESILVVDPENTTVLEQTYDDSYITLITCTPPGTIWKRLVVRARIEKV
jgi:sortase A